MGFSTIVAWMGVFMVLVIATFSLITMYTTHISDMNKIYVYEKELAKKAKSNFEIEHALYTFGRLEVHAKNTGNTLIKINETGVGRCIEAYLDGVWVNQSLFSTDILNTTWSPLLWDPDESLNISINKTVAYGPHVVSIVDCYGTKKSMDFSAPLLEFITPTQPNGTTTTKNWATVKISAASPVIDTLKLNWDGVDYPFYDGDLLLAVNFNNNPVIGENSTQVVDISKYGNNGTCVESDCPTWVELGRYGGAYSFGGGRRFNFSSPESLKPAKDLTLEAWIKNTGSSDLNQNIVLRGSRPDPSNCENSYMSYGLYLSNLGTTAYFGVCDSTNNGYAASYTIPPNSWSHLAGVFNQSSVKLYVNGVLRDVVDLGSKKTLLDSPASFYVGEPANPYPFNGLIDEIRVYNRSLNDLEVLMHYQSELLKYDLNSYILYVNVTNLSSGIHSYYGWVNLSSGESSVTDGGAMRYITVA